MPHPSLSQAEDVNIVNGVHELGHKWCAYPLTRARTDRLRTPISLCIYYPEPLPRARRHVARTAASSRGTCRRTYACAPARHRRYQIAQRLPGRTDHAIRNRYHRLQAMMHDQKMQAQQNQSQMMGQLPPLPEQ